MGDGFLLGTVIALVGFGIVEIYAASAVFALQHYGNGQYFVWRQSIYAVVGFAAMLFTAKVPFTWHRRFTYPLLGIAFALMLATLLGFGRRAGGAARWIHFGSFNIQPAEIAKLALIVWLAYSLSKKSAKIRSFSVGFLPHVLVALLLAFLCLLQPDFGSALMIFTLTFVMLFTAGAKLGYMLGAVVLSLPIFYALIASSEYRMQRIRAFIAPLEHRYGIGYQVSESLMSFGAGGITGVGLGDSRQKLFYLPEAHTDFLSSIIGEELGFVGVLALVLAFCFILYRGTRIAFAAPNEYGTYLAFGLTLFITTQALTNMAMAMGLLPTKGMVLPFMSFGGSSLVMNCAAVGILYNISRYRQGADSPNSARSSSAKTSTVKSNPVKTSPVRTSPVKSSRKREVEAMS